MQHGLAAQQHVRKSSVDGQQEPSLVPISAQEPKSTKVTWAWLPSSCMVTRAFSAFKSLWTSPQSCSTWTACNQANAPSCHQGPLTMPVHEEMTCIAKLAVTGVLYIHTQQEGAADKAVLNANTEAPIMT